MLNRITIMGRLTADPELRYTANETPVATFTVACERDTKNRDGSRETDFINCTAWRQTGEFVNQYFGKGQLVCVTGRLQIRSYTDRAGNKRTVSEVVCDSVYFGEAKKTEAKRQETWAAPPGFEEVEDDGELPY